MSEKVGSIHWDLDLDHKKFDEGVNHVESGTNKMSEGAHKSHLGMIALAASLAVVAHEAIKFGVDCVKAFEDSETKIAQTNAVLKSTGGIAGVTAEAVDKLSKKFEKSTAFSDEQVRSAENMALTFTAIHKDIFPQVTQAALDMATAMNHGLTPSGEEATDTMKLLGKALQDPDKGLGALHRVGVNVDELKKKFVGVNDIATKQKLILEELATEFGGSASSASNTFQGRLQKLKNEFNDLQEIIGKTIINAIEPLMKAFSNWVAGVQKAGGFIQYFQKIFEKHKEILIAIAGAIMAALIPAFIALASSIWTTMAPFAPFLIAGAAIALVIDKIVKSTIGWKAVFQDIKDTITLFISGDFKHGMFGGALNEDSTYINLILGFRDFIKDIIGTIKLFISGDFKHGMFGSAIEEDSPYVTIILNIRDAIKDMVATITLFITGDFKHGMFSGPMEEDSKYVVFILKARETIINFAKDLIDAFQKIAKKVSEFWNQYLSPTLTAIGKIFKAVWNDIIYPIVQHILSMWNSLSNETKTTFAKIAFFIATPFIPIIMFIGWLEKLYEKHAWFRDAVKIIWEAIVIPIQIAWAIIDNIFKVLVWNFQNIIMPTWQILGTVVGAVCSYISGAVNEWWNAMQPIFSYIGGAIEILKSSWNSFSDTIASVWGNVTGIISNAIDTIISFFGKLWNLIPEGVKQMLGLSGGNEPSYGDTGSYGASLNQPAPKAGSKNFVGPTRAAGGWLDSAQASLVGENGPEMFVPSTDGQIIDAQRTASLMSQAMSSKGTQVILNVDMSGIMATSKQHVREVASTFIEAANQELKARGHSDVLIGGDMLRSTQ